LPPTYYRGCWHVVSRGLFVGYRPLSSPTKGLYIPKDFLTHATSLRQGFPHCAIFLIAASRRSRGRVSVPVWLIILSDQLPVVGLVGRYPTNYLIGRRPIPKRIAPLAPRGGPLAPHAVLAALSSCYPPLPGRLSTCYSTVRHYPCGPFDLHTLGTSLAFILSQDQTLHENKFPRERGTRAPHIRREIY
jgi:hypothetical protein